jgi:amino acid adenylation domain-containing protein
VRTGAITQSGTERVSKEVKDRGEQRNEATGVQPPVQLRFLVEGEIEAAVLQSAWQKAAERLSVGIERPEHSNGNGNGVGLRRAPWQEHDLRGLPREQARRWIRSFLDTDAQQGISSQRFPQTRGALLLTNKQECELVWSLHPALSARVDVKQAIRDFVTAGQSDVRVTQLATDCVETEPRTEKKSAEEQLGYWRKQLGGELPVVELPTDYVRPAVRSYRGAQKELRIRREVTEKLKQVSREEGATLFMTLLAGFDVLLARYSGQEELVVGTHVANRTRVEADDSIGCFVNTLVLRMDASGNPRFRELVQRVKQVTLEGYAHRDIPFEKLVEELQPERDLSRTALFQAMFVLRTPMPEGKSAGVRLRGVEIDRQVPKVDLTVTMGETEEGLAGVIEYNTELFEAVTIQRMVGHWERVLEEIAKDAEQRVWELPLIREEERRHVVEEWNQTEGWYPRDRTVVELFEEQVRRTPERVAVVYEGQSLSYRELNRRANQLGRRLRAWGVGPEQLVALCMKRSLEMVVGLLGVLKAGGAYVPLEPDYPRERLEFMVADTGVRVVLSEERYRSAVASEGVRVLSLDTEWGDVAEESGEGLGNEAKPENLAYVIYTSGSTGKPKGVMNTHAGLCNRLWWMQEQYGLGENDRVLQKTPYSFDVSVWEFLWPLITGARLVMARPEAHRDSRYLVDVIEREQITTMHFVPSMLQVFVEEKGLSRCGSLRRVICSGEALGVELQERFFARLGAELHNLYGPTEAAIDVTYWACERGQKRRTVPIGRPIRNLQIYLLDPYRNPVPVGVLGELHIGGVGLARGYLNRAELTAEKFVGNPFRKEPGARLYKTGDLARYSADGVIEYVGRIDHQVKIRGFRIELGEIEAALTEHEGVSECVVLAREDARGQKRLVAYVVAKKQAAPTVTELRKWVKEKLPEYMVPAAFVMLPAIPVTHNGKIDRRALPAPDSTQPELNRGYVEPGIPAEETLARQPAVRVIELPAERIDGTKPRAEKQYATQASQDTAVPADNAEEELIAIWETVLNTKPVRADDDFFDLGGHSLLAIELMARIEDALGVELPLASLLEAPTVRGQARLVRKYRGNGSAEDHGSKQQPIVRQLPFFFLGGDPTFRALSQRLSELREFHSLGLRASLIAKLKDPSSLEGIAEQFVQSIRERRPEGPYMLGGWCAHGLLAFETARQLSARGQEVAQVVLLETANPVRRKQYSGWKRTIARAQLKFHLLKFEYGYLQQLNSTQTRNYIAGRTAQKIARMRQSLRRALKATKFYPELDDPASGNPLDVLYAAAAKYCPRPFGGHVTLIRSTERTFGFGHVLDLGWSELLGNDLEICETSGNHYTIYMQPNVDSLAHKMNICLRKAEERTIRASGNISR